MSLLIQEQTGPVFSTLSLHMYSDNDIIVGCILKINLSCNVYTTYMHAFVVSASHAFSSNNIVIVIALQI